MDVKAYLNRIGFQGDIQPNLDSFRRLHQAHLLAVPFENLDIHLGRPIALDVSWLYEKIVLSRRGGFCYELNGLFAELLLELGFGVQRLSARVANDQGGYGIQFDHMTLLVKLERLWLADVGFGESFRTPLLLDEQGIHTQPLGSYRLSLDSEIYTYWAREEGDWKPQYIFALKPYSLEDFQGGCDYHQSSPRSSFTQRQLCSIATPDGRVTLSGMKLITTTNGIRGERDVEGEAEYNLLLKDLFGVVL